MKFMKLGSKPDAFKSDGNNRRYVANELPNDIVVNVVDVKFYMHKFPILSKCARLQKLMAMTNQETQAEIFIQDIPGGPTAFEICAKYCYGMTVTLNALNVIAVRCAAEYLEMYDTVEKGNLIYKIDVFLKSSIFQGWKDSIIVLQTTKSLLPWLEDIKVINPCLDAIASKASMDTSKVKWSYTYNRKSLTPEKEGEKLYNGVRKELTVPKDWWVEDLSDLDMDLYKRVMTTIKTKGIVSNDVISEALSTYASRKLPGFNKGMVQGGDLSKYKSFLEVIVRLLPREKGSVSSSLLIRLLRASMTLGCGELVRKELMRRVGLQLYKASVPDLLVRSPPGGSTIYDVDLVEDFIKEFVMQDDHDALSKDHIEADFQEVKKTVMASDASKGMVAKLIDCYLAEVSRDPNLSLSKFIRISELVKGFPRPSHDGIYRAIDMFLKEHPGSSKSERKKICQLMDCRKLSMEACEHAVQNERLPLRVVIQVLFVEQAQDLQGPTRALHQSSRSATTNTEDNWDGVPTTKDHKALKGEIANLRIRGATGDGQINDAEKLDASKVRRLLMSKRVFSKQWSTRERDGENSSSDSSESHGSTSNAQETLLKSRHLQS